MGFRIRKSINFGPFRINLSKSGLGASVGCKGYRKTLTAKGRVRDTYTLPGTGISYIKEHKFNKNVKSDNNSSNNISTGINIFLGILITIILLLILF